MLESIERDKNDIARRTSVAVQKSEVILWSSFRIVHRKKKQNKSRTKIAGDVTQERGGVPLKATLKTYEEFSMAAWLLESQEPSLQTCLFRPHRKRMFGYEFKFAFSRMGILEHSTLEEQFGLYHGAAHCRYHSWYHPRLHSAHFHFLLWIVQTHALLYVQGPTLRSKVEPFFFLLRF